MPRISNADRDSLTAQGFAVDTPAIILPEQAEIETVSQDADLKRVASEESFMNEVIRIRLATTTDPNARPFATVTVNAPTNRVQIPRGRVVGIKRMFVEVLARQWETAYTQPVRNMADPEMGNELIGHDALVYPFEVVEDKNPLGRVWLERILQEQH